MNYLHGIRKTRIKQPHLLSWLLLLFPETLSVAVAFQPLSHIQLFVTPWTAACQASLSFTISWSLLKFMSIESVMLSNYLILCCLFSFSLQSFSASGSSPVSPLFASGDQSIGASASVLPVNIQNWFPLLLMVWSPYSPRDSQDPSPAS